jgi:hypothetical protein
MNSSPLLKTMSLTWLCVVVVMDSTVAGRSFEMPAEH